MAKLTTSFGTFAFLPYPATSPMREVLEWKTDVIQSVNGTETAIPLRSKPRQVLYYDIPERSTAKVRSHMTYYGALRESWAVPLWAELQYIGGILQNTVTIDCDTTNYDLREGSLALLWQSDTQYQIIEILSLDGTSITIDGFSDAFQSAYLIPVRQGSLNNVSHSSTGYEGTTTLAYELTDNLDVTETTPTQFLSYDIYLDPTLFNDNEINSTIDTRTDRIDYDVGIVENRYLWTYNRRNRPRNSIAEGKVEIRALRSWLARRMGKYRPFWEPTFENDMTNLSSGALTNKLRVSLADGRQDWTLSQRTHIAVNSAGVWLPRTITGVATPGGDVLEFTLDSNLNINASTIQAISFLGLQRLDTDRAELNWIGNSVVKLALNTTEIRP